MKTFFSFLLTFTAFIQISLAQKQAYNWTFSNSIKVNFMDAGNSTVSFIPLPIPINVPFNECNAVFSDENGNLRCFIVADNPIIIEGEDYLNGKILGQNYATLLNGDSVRIDADITNGAILLPFSDNENLLHLFTLSYDRNTQGKIHGLYYHIIDLTQNKILIKNKLVVGKQLPLGRYWLDEKLAAVRHTNGIDWWLMGYDRNESAFLRWRVTSSGILGPFSQKIGTYAPDSILSSAPRGEMTFNPQGTRLAIVGGAGVFDLFSFDRCTGLLSDWASLINPNVDYINDFNTGTPYSTEFSPNGNILYFGTFDSLFQFDLTAPNIRATQTTLAAIPEQSLIKAFGQIQLSPNGKIYITNYRSSTVDTSDKYLSLIQYPDSVGLGCQFISQGLYLKGKKCNLGLPNMPAYLPGAIAPDIPQANAGPPERFLCPGDSVLLGAPALPGAVYRWRPAVGLSDTTVAMPLAKPDISVTYTLFVSDSAQNICTQTVALTKISIPQFPTGFSVAIDAFLATFTVNTEVGATHKKYKWKFGDNASLTKTYPIAYHTYQDTGTYFVKLTIIDTLSGCEKTFSDTLILKVSGEQEYCIDKTTHFRVYPNPSAGVFQVKAKATEAGTLNLSVYDALGKHVYGETLRAVQNLATAIDLRDRPAGIYLLKVETAQGVFTQRLIKE